jgi:proteic killer suppression protein
MQIVFEKEYLEELYHTKTTSDKKHRFQPGVVKNYIKRVTTLAEAPNVESLFPIKALNYEVLSGNKKGISSIRIDKKYRLEFIVTNDKDTIIKICTLTEISNHYK